MKHFFFNWTHNSSSTHDAKESHKSQNASKEEEDASKSRFNTTLKLCREKRKKILSLSAVRGERRFFSEDDDDDSDDDQNSNT